MAFEDVFIKDFIDCWFKKDYSKISKDDFGIIYGEYMDASGLFATQQFDLAIYIQDLTNRLDTIKIFIDLQLRFLEEFGVPYVDHFSFVEQFGHKMIWQDEIQFKELCRKIISRENKYETILKVKKKQLDDLKKREAGGVVLTETDSRRNFLTMLNGLGKLGYKIDKFTTTVEELALMIKQQKEEYEEFKTTAIK